MADLPEDDLEDLSSYFESNIARQKASQKPQSNRKKPNLIQQAADESTAIKKPGRKPNPLKEKATKQVAGYVTPSVKLALDEKRGLVSESKIIARLVEMFVNDEVKI